MVSKPNSNKQREIRHARVRNKISGTADRPRLNVYRSLNNIYAQVIDDSQGTTLCAASSLDKALEAKLQGKNKQVRQGNIQDKAKQERNLQGKNHIQGKQEL